MRHYSLVDLEDQETGILGTDDSPTNEVRKRLSSMGFVEGTSVTRVLTAPLGDPRAYQMDGVLMALRNCDAANVALQPRRTGAPPSRGT